MHNPHIIRRLKYRFNFYSGAPLKSLRNILLTIILILGLAISFFRVESRLFSLGERIAFSDLENHISKQTNIYIEQILRENGIDLNSIISSDNGSQEIPFLSTDFSELNFLKTEIAERLTSYMETQTYIDCKIPSMALISDSIFAGYGFEIPLRLITSGSAYADFSDTFISSGINQTKYRLSVIVTVNIELQSVFSEKKSSFTTEIPLAEKIIIGNAPELIFNQ